MPVVRLHAPGDLRWHREPGPDLGPGKALLDVQAVGICVGHGAAYEAYLPAGVKKIADVAARLDAID